MLKIFLFFLVAALTLPSSVYAGQSAWESKDAFRAQLISGVDQIGEKEQIEAALVIEMADGWHTYWKHPGDTGLAPKFNWDASDNVQDVAISWPLPKRKEEAGLFRVFGYSGAVTFPLDVKLTQPGEEATLDLDLQIMVCKDICIPEQVSLALPLPAGEFKASSKQKRIEFARRKTPHQDALKGLTIDTVVAGQEKLAITVQSAKGFEKADIFVHTDAVGLTGDPAMTADLSDETRAIYSFDLPEGFSNFDEILNAQTLSITFTDGQRAVEKTLQY